MTWTKGFDIKGVEGEDVVLQLGQALESRVSHVMLTEPRRNVISERMEADRENRNCPSKSSR